MKIEFGYGCGSQTLCVPDENVLGVLQQNELALPEKTARELVAEAIAHPIGCPPLREIVHRGEKIAIVTSDITRPLPSYEILPELLRALFACGVEAADVTVVFAIGSHRRHTPEEMRQLAGDYAFETVRCVDSDPDDCVRLGVTDRGTPVDITRAVAEADRRICLGNVEFHWFAGYSGGAKMLKQLAAADFLHAEGFHISRFRTDIGYHANLRNQGILTITHPASPPLFPRPWQP